MDQLVACWLHDVTVNQLESGCINNTTQTHFPIYPDSSAAICLKYINTNLNDVKNIIFGLQYCVRYQL